MVFMIKFTKENRETIICAVIILLFVIKLFSLPADVERIREDGHESDLSHYLKISKWFTGSPPDESARTYQYPPFYPILLIPASFMDTVTFVLVLNIILGVLTFFPLYLISRRYTGFLQSVLISGLVITLNMLFSIKSYGYPMILTGFLFAWFIYFLPASLKERRSFYLASLSFALLLATKYVFFYLLPVIFIWFLYHKRHNLRSGLKNILQFGILPAVFFLGWSLRNILIHGLSMRGAIGGYDTLADNSAFLAIHVETIPSKLMSIFTCLEPNAVMIYFLLFFFSLIIMKMKKESISIEKWFLVLIFVIFFCFPAMTYDRFYLNWRYLIPLTPVYLVIAISAFFRSLFRGIQQPSPMAKSTST